MANANPDGPRKPGGPRIPDAFNNPEGLYNFFTIFCKRAFNGGFFLFQNMIEMYKRLVTCLNLHRDDSKKYNDEMDKMFESFEQEFCNSARKSSRTSECNDEMEKKIQGHHEYSMICDKEILRITPNDTNEEKEMKMAFCAANESNQYATKQNESYQYATKQNESYQYATKQNESYQYATKQNESYQYATKQNESYQYATKQNESYQYATKQNESYQYATEQNVYYQYVATKVKELYEGVKNQISNICNQVWSLFSWS